MDRPTRSRRGKRNRPCDFCRRKKSRCVFKDSEASCMVCQSYSVVCSFLEDPRPRKRKTTSNSATFDTTSSSFRHTTQPSNSDIPTRDESFDVTTDGPSTASPVPETRPAILGLQQRHHCQYISSFGTLSPVVHLISISQDFTPKDQHMRRVGPTDMFLIISDDGTPGYENELRHFEAIEALVAPYGPSLIKLFFRSIHGSYPILHKPYHVNGSGPIHHNFSAALLACVYLLALRYWSYDAELVDSPKPDSAELERLARETLSNDFHRPTLSTIAAGLFMLQYSDVGAAELTSQLISIGFKLGIHADASGWQIPAWEIGLRKRIAWALYMQDAWSAVGSGRPRLISTSNWNVQPLAHDDFSIDFAHENAEEGSSEVEKGKFLFSYMVSLTGILADILETMYSMKAENEFKGAGDHELELILQKAKPLQLRLKEWYSNVPENLSMSSMRALKLSSAGSLRLDYLTTEATIHRRILAAVSQHQPDLELRRILVTAASTRLVATIDFVQALKPQDLISFWYTNSKSNLSLIGTLGIMLCTTSTNITDQNHFKEQLKAYQWALRVNVEAGASFMKPALCLLEANMRVSEEMGQSDNHRHVPRDVEENSEIRDAEPTPLHDHSHESYLEPGPWTLSPGASLNNHNVTDGGFSLLEKLVIPSVP